MNRDKFFQRENGEWWFKGNGTRTNRVHIRICSNPECKKEFFALIRKTVPDTKYCSRHCAAKMQLNRRKAGKADKHHFWKGGRACSDGYIKIYVPEHPYAKFKYVMEHRLVMEKYLERYLTESETVHHRNGIRDDNRIENLELWTTRHPKGCRYEDLIQWAIDFLKIYAPEKLNE